MPRDNPAIERFAVYKGKGVPSLARSCFLFFFAFCSFAFFALGLEVEKSPEYSPWGIS